MSLLFPKKTSSSESSSSPEGGEEVVLRGLRQQWGNDGVQGVGVEEVVLQAAQAPHHLRQGEDPSGRTVT